MGERNRERGVVQRHVTQARKDLGSLHSAIDEAELRQAWERFITCAKRALELGNKLAADEEEACSWAKAHRGRYQGGDAGLTYVWQARNALDHGLVAIADVKPAQLSIAGGTMLLGEKTNTWVRNSVLTKPDGSSFFVDDLLIGQGQIAYRGNGNPEIARLPPRIRLAPVYSEIKKKTFLPPKSLAGYSLVEGNPRSLGTATCNYLEQMVAELKAWFPAP